MMKLLIVAAITLLPSLSHAQAVTSIETTSVAELISAPQLTGQVYSNTSVEIFWNRERNPNVRYDIFRDGELVREASPATSQFQSELDPGTTYLFKVVPFLNGIEQSSSQIMLTTRGGTGEQSPVTPTPPVGVPTLAVTGLVYSSSSIELFWDRSDNNDVRYNILRDGVILRAESPATSQFDPDLQPNTTYVYNVVQTLNSSTIATGQIELTTRAGTGAQTPTTPDPQPEPTPNDVQINLTGQVYSSSAIELFWDRSDNPDVRYNVFRDGELIRPNSPAISQGDASLMSGTTHQYRVDAILNNATVASEQITLTTRGEQVAQNPTTPEPEPPVDSTTDITINLTGQVYSSTSIELFWDRSDNPDVRYDIVRDNELVRFESPATSQFELGLSPGTTYIYTVAAILGNETVNTDQITLTTRGDVANAQAPEDDENNTTNGEAVLSIIREDTFENILRNVVSHLNAVEADGLRNELITLFSSLTFTAVGEEFAGNTSGELAALGLVRASTTELGTDNLVDYSCSNGGTLSMNLSPGVTVYTVTADNCAIEGATYTGVISHNAVGREGTFSRLDGVTVVRADGSSYAITGTRRTSVNRIFTVRSISWEDASYAESNAEENFSVGPYTIDSESRDGNNLATREDEHSATMDASFTISAAYTDNQPMSVSANLSLGFDTAGEPAQQWTDGALLITADDGSSMLLSPSITDTSLFDMRVEGVEEILQRRWDDGFQVWCFGPTAEFSECQPNNIGELIR